MSPILIHAALYGILLPGVVAVAVIAIARPWRRESDGLLLPALASVALFAAYVVGHLGLTGTLEFSPIDISNWLPHVAALGALLGLALAFIRQRRALRSVAVFAVGVAVIWLVLRPQLAFRFTGATGLLVVLGGGLALGAYYVAVERVLIGESARVGALFAVILAGVAPAIVALSGSLLLGQLGGVVASGVGALAAVALIFNHPALVRALPGFLAMTTGAFIALAYLYASMRYQTVLALAFAPMAVVAVRPVLARFGPRESRRFERYSWLARAAVLLVFAGLAGFFASVEEPADEDAGEYDYGYQ
jgi:hypothetical protein